MTIEKMFSLKGKKAIVTGGAMGLGRGMAEALADAGAEVVVLDKCKVNIETLTPQRIPFYVVADLSNRGTLKESFYSCVRKLGGIDILVNSAGIQRREKSENFALEDWDDVLEVNLSATFQMCQLAGKEMLNQRHGKIINIASMLSFTGGYTVPAYAASKGGVAQLTKTLANEWGRKGVNVNAIAPGFMDTDMNKTLIADRDRNESILSRIAAGRWGKPEDVKGAVVFLASPASDYLHGTILPVDGGYLCS
jgi:2-dehydro-3-deoxy-D-gluconate 5-dehydrogenase